MEISVKLFVYCFIIGILHCPNYAQANQSINQSINQLYLKHGEIISIFTKLQEELKIYIQDNHR